MEGKLSKKNLERWYKKKAIRSTKPNLANSRIHLGKINRSNLRHLDFHRKAFWETKFWKELRRKGKASILQMLCFGSRDAEKPKILSTIQSGSEQRLQLYANYTSETKNEMDHITFKATFFSSNPIKPYTWRT